MINRLSNLERTFTGRMAEIEQRKADLVEFKNRQKELVQKEVDLKKVEAAVATLANLVYGESAESLASVLNYGIKTAYPREVTAIVEKSVSAGRPTLKIGLMDGGTEPIDPESAHGGGLAQILGFLSRVIVVLATEKRRILILDETFSAVSKDLLPALSALLRAIVEELDFQVIAVTHQAELGDAAHRLYQVTAPGKIEEIETA